VTGAPAVDGGALLSATRTSCRRVASTVLPSGRVARLEGQIDD